jgi:hypothetical protein
MIGLDTDIFVPLSRGDEHHAGRDALAALVRRGLVPDGRYYPVFVSSCSYFDLDTRPVDAAERRAQAARVNDAREAARRFIAWGGGAIKPMMISLHSGLYMARRWLMTIREFVDGVWLAPTSSGDDAQALDGLDRLSEYAGLIIGLLGELQQAHLRRTRAVFERGHALVDVLQKIIVYGCPDLGATKINACEAALLGCEAAGDVDGVGAIVFGLDGIKNRLHNVLRRLCAKPDGAETEFDAWAHANERLFWGDARAALAEFDRLSNT